MRLRDISIKQKMLLMTASTSLIVLALSSVAWMAYDWSLLRHSSEDNLKVTAGIIGSNISAALNFKMQEDATSTLTGLKEKNQIIEAAIYDAKGDLFVSYNRSDAITTIPQKIDPLKESIEFQSDGIFLYKKINFQNEFIGTIYIRSDLSELESRISFGIQLALLIMVAAVALSMIISLRLQTFITTPIKSLVTTMKDVALGENFHLRATKKSEDEVGSLVDGFNTMLAQLEERDKELKQHRDHLEEEVAKRTLELRRTSGAFQESELKIRSIVDAAADGIITFDSNGRILSFNRAACEVFGYSAEEIIGQELSKLTECQRTSNPALGLTEHLMARARKAAIVGREFEGLSKDGRKFPMELSVTRILFHQKELFTAILRDITARKAAEAQLIRAKEEAENLARTKSQFLANMSHEIRTPMNGIFGTLQLVLKSKLDDEQREFLEMMKGCADSLLRIVNDVLDFSKADAGKLQLESVAFRYRESLRKTLRVIAVKAEEQNVNFQVIVDDDVPDNLIGDSHRLGQILLNLTANALKFTKPGGQVTIKTSLKSANADAIFLHFTVKDNGIGIPEEKQKVIFDAFTQADTSSTRKYGGTGLGLAIVSNLVKLMGGDIWVKSKVEEGSEFHFTALFQKQTGAAVELSLIEKKDSQTSNSNNTNLTSSTRQIRVLLVEDHPINQKVQRRFLEDLGLNVTLAENGRIAVEVSAKQEFDLIMMDCQMPEMDGFEATDAIRKREANSGKRMPIVAMTAHALEGDRERCLEAGMDEYVSKPIDEGILREVIHKVLEKNINKGS